MIGHLADIVVYPSDRAVYVRQLDMEHIAGYLKSHDCQEFEYRSLMPDGTYHHYLNTIVVLRADKDGTPLAAVSLVRDIHRKRRKYWRRSGVRRR